MNNVFIITVQVIIDEMMDNPDHKKSCVRKFLRCQDYYSDSYCFQVFFKIIMNMPYVYFKKQVVPLDA
jgi:hypothetical protein